MVWKMKVKNVKANQVVRRAHRAKAAGGSALCSLPLGLIFQTLGGGFH